MRSRLSEFKYLFSKFGVLTKNEIRILYGDESPGRSQLDRYIAELRHLKLVRRRADPDTDLDVFEAVPHLLQRTGVGPRDGFRDLRDNEIRHRLDCAQALAWLCRRSFVSGVAIEHELSPNDYSKFSPGRIPDGIAEISRPGRTPFEVAIEVERTQRNDERTKRLLELYERTILAGRHQCRGLLVIATEDSSYSQYERLLAARPDTFRNKVILSKFIDTRDVADELLGTKYRSAISNPRNPCGSRRQSAHETAKYLNDFLLRSRKGTPRGAAGQRFEPRQETNV